MQATNSLIRHLAYDPSHEPKFDHNRSIVVNSEALLFEPEHAASEHAIGYSAPNVKGNV